MDFIEIPTNNNGKWEITAFRTKEDFKDFVLKLFKEPGKYEFDEAVNLFNEQAKKFHKDGYYCDSPMNTRDFFKYWGTLKDEDIFSEKSKCRKGVIFINKDKTFYLTRDYYFWLNFLPIYDKEKRKYDFPNVWDSQYHLFLYELLAELHYKHVIYLKKRQYGATYMHCAKLINRYWFEEGVTLKIGASLKDYINEKGAWKILNEYENFLNKNAWYRNSEPHKVMTWQQRQQVVVAGKNIYEGNKSTITGHSFEKDATSGVGGATLIFYHEEAGIAPKMDTTYEYIRPALSTGLITTGTFIAGGSVGDLDQCQPLKRFMLDPVGNSFYPVESTLLDDKGTKGLSGLFIPEQWSMPPYIDEYGNSQVEQALEAILQERLIWKKSLDPETYQLRISQKPINIYEAFNYRKQSVFPLALINRQIERIENKDYFIEYVDLERDGEGKVKILSSNRLPISETHISKSIDDKRGVICMYERPISNPDYGTYVASIDPVREGKSTSSESLCSIIVYRTDSEVSKMTGNDVEHYIDRGKVVLSWCGRYDDLKDTHEQLELILELYNARAICEVNVSEFVTYMKDRKKQHWLVPRKELISFTKDQKGVSETYQEYGWKNTGSMFQHLLSYGISFLKEKLEEITKPDGTVVKTVYGIERIPDILLLREMLEYQEGDKKNYDRLISYCALVTYVTIQNADRGLRKRVEKIQNLEKPDKFRNLLYGESQPKRQNPFAKPNLAFRHYK